MVKKRIVLTKQEYRQLSQILNAMKSNHRLNQPHLISLYEEVGDAVIMERDGFSSGYVTLNATPIWRISRNTRCGSFFPPMWTSQKRTAPSLPPWELR